MEPVVVISLLVQTLGWTLPAVVIFRRDRVPWREVVQQRPGPAVQITCFERAVQVQTVVEVSIHRTHQSVQHIACTMAARMVVSDAPLVSLGTQIQRLFQHHAAEILSRPVLERTDALRESPTIRGAIGIPYFFRHFMKHFAQVVAT